MVPWALIVFVLEVKNGADDDDDDAMAAPPDDDDDAGGVVRCLLALGAWPCSSPASSVTWTTMVQSMVAGIWRRFLIPTDAHLKASSCL